MPTDPVDSFEPHRRAREAGLARNRSHLLPQDFQYPKTYSERDDPLAKTSYEYEWWTHLPQSDSPAPPAESGAWPLKRVAELAGDVVIGGLHMIHERNARMTCGPIMPQGGVQVSFVVASKNSNQNANERAALSERHFLFCLCAP